jgi:hypothetical protein
MNPHKKKSFLFCFLVLYANIGNFFFTLFTSFNSLHFYIYLFIYIFTFLCKPFVKFLKSVFEALEY